MKHLILFLTLTIAVQPSFAQKIELEKIKNQISTTNSSGFILSQNIKEVDSTRQSMGQDRGGGDVACENRIKQIRNDLSLWIQKGGHTFLDLKGRGSATEYKQNMLDAISKTDIQCVGEGDRGFPVVVYGIAKTCAVDRGQTKNLMTCDFNKVVGHSEEDLYRQVHHEFATLAGFEKPNRGDSDYEISDQLGGYLEQQVVLKLVVKNDPSKILNLENLREGMKFALGGNGVSTYDCSAEGEGYSLSPFKYVEELDKMTAVRKNYWDLQKGSYFEYLFSYVDENDVKYEERITTSENKVLSSVSLTILRKQKVNIGTLEAPKFVVEHTATGKIQCKIEVR